MEQNRELKIRPHRYGQLIFEKEVKVMQWSKNSLFNQWAEITEYIHKKVKKIHVYRVYFSKLTQMDHRPKCQKITVENLGMVVTF